jgi:ABC-type sugar transport system ATPase subunit
MKVDQVPRLEFQHVTVSYGPIRAVDDLCLSIARGEVVGLLGHNGAGKSTVVNAATGAVGIEFGMIVIDGEAAPRAATPRELGSLGIIVVHQEPALAGNLSVLDNLFLGRHTALSRSQRLSRATEVLQAVRLNVPLDFPVQALGLGQRQLLDIARGLVPGNMKVLFLDEPTAALGEEDTHKLHELIREMSRNDVTVVYVSHRLRDIIDVCERFVVLRDGVLVLDEPIAGFTAKTLANTLAPLSANDDVETRKEPAGSPIIKAANGIEIKRGEIVGLFGMAAGEQFHFLEMLFGMRPCVGIESDQERYNPRSPRQAIAWGTFMVQGDRERDSLVSTMSAFDNVFLPWHHLYAGPLGISSAEEDETYAEARGAFRIVGPPGEAPIGAFSGGNRQKHVLARWIVPRKPRILLLAQPTQGVDEASKRDTRVALRRLAADGVAIAIASAESDEISGTCDRAYVMDGGEAHPLARSADFDEKLLELLMSITLRDRNNRA